MGAAGVQKVLQVLDLRLPGCVFDHGGTLSGAGAEHQVFRCSHGGEIQRQPFSGEVGAGAAKLPARILHRRPQFLEAPQVEVDGPWPQLTAAGVAQLRLAAAAQDGA